jgi:fumarate reductase (CoM/CoB) subunit A
MEMDEIIKAEVLIVGGGGAAARAALEARKRGAEVVLATKGSFGAIGTRGAGATASALSEFGVIATPGWTGDLSEVERPLAFKFFTRHEQAFANIIQVGLGMTDPKLARIIVEEAVQTRTELLHWGATFGKWGIKSHGVPIMEALQKEVEKAGVFVRERIMVVNLLVQDGECVGAIGIDEMKGDIILFQAPAIVIATGGDANLFMLNLNPPDNTGDGYAMGYLAGAELMNLEFRQIFLMSVYPTKNMLIRMVQPYAKLTNVEGEEFLQSYLPQGTSLEECLAQRQLHNPFSTRDTLSKYVDIAIVNEVKAGRGTQHHSIYLDRRDPRIPPIPVLRNEFLLYRGIEFDKSPVEIGVGHHSTLGGFRIDENAQTTVPHLYAAGEAAAGPHGADRMGGHMLLASQVFGARAGRHSAAYARGRKLPDIDTRVLRVAKEQIKSLHRRKGDQQAAVLKGMLQQSAYYNLLVMKSEESLNRFLDEVRYIRQKLVPRLSVANTQALVEALELQNLLSVAELEATVCLERAESRGPHYREDFPEQDDKNWLRSIIAKKAGDRLRLEPLTLDPGWKDRGDEKVKMWG